MAEKEKKPIFKRWWFWTVLVFIILIGASASANKSSNTQTVGNSNADTTNSNTNTANAAQNTAATATPAETITITHSVYKAGSYGTFGVDGDATNNDSVQHSATLKATFYDGSGNILGTAEGAVDDIAPGQTKTFTLEGTDNVTGYATMKVQVDTLL